MHKSWGPIGPVTPEQIKDWSSRPYGWVKSNVIVPAIKQHQLKIKGKLKSYTFQIGRTTVIQEKAVGDNALVVIEAKTLELASKQVMNQLTFLSNKVESWEQVSTKTGYHYIIKQ